MTPPYLTAPLQLAPVAVGLLAEVVAFYEAHGVPLPERRVVLPGAPGVSAWDCEQVTVHLASVNAPGGPGAVNPQLGGPAGVGLMRSATWAVQVVRCTPPPRASGQPPSVAALQVSGEEFLRDAGLLSQCFVLMAADPRALDRPWLPPGGTVSAGTVVALGPDQFHGLEAQVTITAAETTP